jgi:lysophospholipase L1-like esterase
MGADDLRLLQGHYFTSNSNAKTTFRGTKRPAHTDSWTRSSMLFVSPNAGSIIMTLSDGTERTYDIQPSNDVQMIELNGFTTSVAMSTDIDGLKSLGLWFTGDTGISLDCMSLRGNSGISHRTLNEPVAAQMRRYINYDVVVLEFGINALSSEQTDYTAYANAMTQVVNKVRACYPNAVVLILGIGDRGQKHGSDVGSLVTAGNMVRAQRGVARSTHALFWDTRQAMGGEGSVVDWHRRGLINADYIHLNHKGGKALAEIFVKSLKLSICE